MWARYLTAKLNLNDLGYYERVTESAVQYSERLLAGKQFAEGQTAQSLASRFVHDYKNHAFVIDVDEATLLLGGNIVKRDTPELEFAEEIYDLFTDLGLIFSVIKRQSMRCVGGLEDILTTRDLPKS